MLLISAVLLIANGTLFAQNPSKWIENNSNKPKLEILTDTVKLGEPLLATFSYYHPRSMEVLFPDSSDDFGPLEYLSRVSYSTQSNDTMSFDCTIYTLQAFELDPVQPISLSAKIYTASNEINLKSNLDTIYLKEIIEKLPSEDSLAVLINTNFMETALVQNNPMYVYTVLGGILTLLVIIVLFGRRVIRVFRISRLRKEHVRFEKVFDDLAKDQSNAEELIRQWKLYLGKLEKKDIASLTTKEIYAHYSDDQINDILSNLDAFVFGGIEFSMTWDGSARYLKTFSNELLTLRIEKLKAKK